MAGANYATLADQIATRTAQQYGLDPNYFRAIFHAQINQESGFNPNARSPAGAIGIAQIVPKYHPGVDPLNPQAALAYAAKWDAQNFKKYGNAQDVLSVYNSGSPYAQGRNISETNNYVRSILSAAKTGGKAPKMSPSAALSYGSPQKDTSSQRMALLQSLMSLQTPSVSPQEPFSGAGNFNPMADSHGISLGTISNILNAAWGTPGSNPPKGGKLPPPGLIGISQGKGKSKLTVVPTNFTTRGGIQLQSNILGAAEQLAKQYGVKINSGYRSAAHNAAVGGAPHSDHLSGDAVDFTGSPAAMRALYNYAIKAGYAYVEPWAQAGGNHVHISFARGRVKA